MACAATLRPRVRLLEHGGAAREMLNRVVPALILRDTREQRDVVDVRRVLGERRRDDVV